MTRKSPTRTNRKQITRRVMCVCGWGECGTTGDENPNMAGASLIVLYWNGTGVFFIEVFEALSVFTSGSSL